MIRVFLFCLLLTSCAKMSYLYEQGSGQFGLLWNAKKNDELLSDPSIPSEVKRKIRNVQKYKGHFYSYFDRQPSKIYSKTTLLEQKAVTYLVITSPYDRISAQEECFPFMGCFPYLGFYELRSAKNYAREQELKKGFVSYIRPVYAYSTLGYFTDTILSSFFEFDEFELGELIFHELFHTIFFIKNEVELNESLANYFGKEMAIEYFALKDNEKKDLERQRENRKALSREIVTLAQQLDLLLKERKFSKREDGVNFTESFVKTTFYPRISKKCQDLGLKKCSVLKREWNNASFAAYMTYESESERIHQLRLKKGLSLKDYFTFIEREYQLFKKSSKEKSFSAFLFKNLD